MTNEQASIILRKYNEFRRADGDYDLPYTAKEIGEAIDYAVAALEPKVPMTLDGITEAVCKETGITTEELMSPNRDREYAEARWMIWWIANANIGCSMTTLARYTKRNAHATVMHGIARGDEMMEDPRINPEWVERVERITKRLDNG